MVDILSVSINYLLLTVAFIAMGRLFYHDIIPTVKSGFVESKVLKSGIAVNADIINVHQTTAWGGNKPIYMLTFHYETHDDVEYESSIKKALSNEEIERFRAGNGTTIKYDPHNPKSIALYDRPLILGG